MPNTGITHLVAKAGSLTDEGTIRKVSSPNPDYILKEKGAILNWWDITEIDGHASLNTKIRVLIAKLGLQETANLVAPVMGPMFAAHAQALYQLDSFTVLRMVSLVTGTMGIPVTKEMLMDLNAQMNKISLT